MKQTIKYLEDSILKKREGYISFIALIIMSVSMIMTMQIIVLSELQTKMINARKNNIQSYYLSEGKILMSLYEDKYYYEQLNPALLDVFRRHNFATKQKNIIIDDFDLEEGDSCSYVNISFQDRDNRKEMVLVAKSDYMGMDTSVKSYSNLVNKLFEIKNPVLAMDEIEPKYKDELEKLLENIEENITAKNIDKPESVYTGEFSNFEEVNLEKLDSKTHKITCTRKTMNQPYIETFDKREVFIAIKRFQEKKAKFHINDNGNKIRLSGIIYVEGDMVISGNFTFNGIIIVKDGEIRINSKKEPIIRGMIISYDKNIREIKERIDLEYSSFLVYKYGTFIPGFLEIDMKFMKNGK